MLVIQLDGVEGNADGCVVVFGGGWSMASLK
jgi:hypothetical protein